MGRYITKGRNKMYMIRAKRYNNSPYRYYAYGSFVDIASGAEPLDYNQAVAIREYLLGQGYASVLILNYAVI